MTEVKTIPGKTYAVTSASGCTVTMDDGTVVLSAQAGIQGIFTAPAGSVQLSDDAAILTEIR